MSMEDLSSILWHERDLLDLLLFKLEVQQLVLSNGRSHWLARAGREIEAVLEKIREVELLRAVTTDTLASELGLEPDASLRTISQTSAEPWRGIWLDHREALIDASTRISQMYQGNGVLATAGYQAARASAPSTTEQSGTYAAGGSVQSARRVGPIFRNLC